VSHTTIGFPPLPKEVGGKSKKKKKPKKREKTIFPGPNWGGGFRGGRGKFKDQKNALKKSS